MDSRAAARLERWMAASVGESRRRRDARTRDGDVVAGKRRGLGGRRRSSPTHARGRRRASSTERRAPCYQGTHAPAIKAAVVPGRDCARPGPVVLDAGLLGFAIRGACTRCWRGNQPGGGPGGAAASGEAGGAAAAGGRLEERTEWGENGALGCVA
jgi:hypothetical protein